jgi:hypothetical protein
MFAGSIDRKRLRKKESATHTFVFWLPPRMQCIEDHDDHVNFFESSLTLVLHIGRSCGVT